MGATESKEQISQISLNVLVDEKKNKVVYVEAGKDFADILLSFLTLPLGTIARLVGKESNMNKVNVGGLCSLYQSVGNMENKHFLTYACKEMLLQPRNPMESCIQNLKLNIDDTKKTQYFICENLKCTRSRRGGLLSTFKNQRCKCGKLMNRVIDLHSSLKSASEGFVLETTTFIITDDLKIISDDFQISCLPLNHGYEEMDALKLVTVNVTQKEIVDLLKCSLISATPLTDVLLLKKQLPENSEAISVWKFDFDSIESDPKGKEDHIQMMMKVKLIVRKSNKSVLFAVAEEDFVDFLFSFLTLPLGGVEHMFNGKSCLGSIDNLYKSILGLDCNRYLRSPDLKDKLVKTPLAYQFKLRNKILPIEEVPPFYYSFYSGGVSNDLTSSIGNIYLTAFPDIEVFRKEDIYAPLSYLEPQSSNGEAYSERGGRGFVRKPSLYMVTDDLVVMPSSSVSAISFVTKFRVPSSDLIERVIKIGQKEGLCILKACLISSSTLTNGLSQFIKIHDKKKFPKREKP